MWWWRRCRSLLDALPAIERIHKAGGHFVSVDESLDIRTPAGELALRLMLSVAEFELRRIRESWDATRRTNIARGVHAGSYAPFGYRHNKQLRLVIDRSAGRCVREIFRRRAAGEAIADITQWLNRQSVAPPFGGASWSRSTLYGILENRTWT